MGDPQLRGPIMGEPTLARGARGPVGLDGAATAKAALKEFKRALRERQIEYLVSVKKRAFFRDLSDMELERIDPNGPHRMRREAALACRELLAEARAALSEAQSGADRTANQTKAIGVQSAYRSFREDERAWNNTFNKYYGEMVESQLFAGNELGAAALQHMFELMKKYKAPPGYSNHSNGMAVDFNTVQGKVKYEAKKAQNVGWKRTWLHSWLVANAARFGFKPLATEAWHWDYDSALKARKASAPTIEGQPK